MNEDAKQRRVNWRQAIAEVSLIMVGILGALAVDSWWDERAERVAEGEYLQSLKADFEANREELNSMIEEKHRVFNVGKEIHSIIQSGLTKNQQKEIVEQLGDFYRLSVWNPITGTYDEMIGSGGFSYIQNRALRIELSKYAKGMGDIKTTEEAQDSSWFFEQAPFVLEHLLYTNLGWLGDHKPDSMFSENFQALETRKFWNLVSEWMAIHYDAMRSYERAIDSGNDILELIDVELAKKNRNTE
jgi:hypothetical protein